MLRKYSVVIVALVAICFLFSALAIADEKAAACDTLKKALDKAKSDFERADKMYKDKCKMKNPMCDPLEKTLKIAKENLEKAEKAYKEGGCE